MLDLCCSLTISFDIGKAKACRSLTYADGTILSYRKRVGKSRWAYSLILNLPQPELIWSPPGITGNSRSNATLRFAEAIISLESRSIVLSVLSLSLSFSHSPFFDEVLCLQKINKIRFSLEISTCCEFSVLNNRQSRHFCLKSDFIIFCRLQLIICESLLVCRK